MADSASEILGRNFKRIREAKNLGQQEVADRLNVKRPYVSQIETGKVGFSGESLMSYAAALGCEPWELFQSQPLRLSDMAGRTTPNALAPTPPMAMAADEIREALAEARQSGRDIAKLEIENEHLRQENKSLKEQLAKANAVYSAYEKLSPDLKLAADALLSTSQEELDEIHAQSLRSLSEPSLKKS